MPEIFTAAYLAPPLAKRRGFAASSAEAVAFQAADDFPYDVGDDPAFFSARFHSGPVTWGVCRSDVRRAVQPGDIVAFFSAQRDETTKCTAYRFVAALEVERKISHEAIFEDEEPLVHRYLNLLARRRDGGWEHYEPAVAEKEWHRDWLWRLGPAPETGKANRWLKEDAVAKGKAHRPGDYLTEAKVKSYVVFSQDQSLVMPEPPLVAMHRPGDGQETWEDSSLSNAIKSMVFGDDPPRRLRTTNRQQPHRHRRRAVDAGWLDDLRDHLALRM